MLAQGRIEQIAAPGEIYDAPATPFVAEFVGTMNRLEGTVEEDGVVAYGDKLLSIAAVRGRTKGERVMVLGATGDGGAPACKRRRLGRGHGRDRLAHVPRRDDCG